jgi:hypothetical protein
MIFEIFSPTTLAKIFAFFAQTAAVFFKKIILTLVFEQNATSFTKNWQKITKIFITASSPGFLLKAAENVAVAPEIEKRDNLS